MYQPETSITGFGDKVIVLTDETDCGYAFGTYTGESRPDSESYEVRIIDAMTDDTISTRFYHKEDIFKSNTENLERVRVMTE